MIFDDILNYQNNSKNRAVRNISVKVVAFLEKNAGAFLPVVHLLGGVC